MKLSFKFSVETDSTLFLAGSWFDAHAAAVSLVDFVGISVSRNRSFDNVGQSRLVIDTNRGNMGEMAGIIAGSVGLDANVQYEIGIALGHHDSGRRRR